MNDQASKPAVPVVFWVVSIVSLLWNCFGGYLYTKANLGDAALMATVPQAMQDYMAHMPIWAHSGWALGIGGSVAGSILLLLRSRHAVTAFAVSLLGAVVSYAAQAIAGVLTLVEPLAILAVILLQWWYSRRAVAAGFLR